MNKRAKFKVEDLVEFNFAGSIHRGKIIEIRKELNKVSYKVVDNFYTYPVNEDDISKKL
jgi:hypothetical protein